MQRQIGRIQIDHHLLRRFALRFQKDLHQQFVDRRLLVVHSLVTILGRNRSTEFQTIQRALARQRLLRFSRSPTPALVSDLRAIVHDRSDPRSPVPSHKCVATASRTRCAALASGRDCPENNH